MQRPRWCLLLLDALVAVAAVTALTPVAPASADVTQPGGTFLDDDGLVHEGAIEALAERGALTGCRPGPASCPSAPLRRGQMASLLARALALPPAGADRFPDHGGVHEDAINRLAAAGLVVGRVDGTFGADAPVARAQLASVLARATAPPPQATVAFVDVAGVHAPAIHALAAAGVARGCDAAGSRFCPDLPVSRAQAASLVARALGIPARTPPPLDAGAPVEAWCRAALGLVALLDPDDAELLARYDPWDVGPVRPGAFPEGAALHLRTVSPFTGDHVKAAWSSEEGLLLDLGEDADATWPHPVVLEQRTGGWRCFKLR